MRPTFTKNWIDSVCADLNDTDEFIVRSAFTTRGANGGVKLRASKPFKTVKTFYEGCANYFWRNLAFDLVAYGNLACMPVTDVFELYAGVESRNDTISRGDRLDEVRMAQVEMDDLVKTVGSTLPLEAKQGLVRWGRALGVI